MSDNFPADLAALRERVLRALDRKLRQTSRMSRNGLRFSIFLAGAMGVAVFLFFSPAFIALTEAISFAIALLSDGRLIVPRAPAPTRPERW